MMIVTHSRHFPPGVGADARHDCESDQMTTFTWGDATAPLFVTSSDDRPVALTLDRSVQHDRSNKHAAGTSGTADGMVEILAVGHGRGLTNTRTARTAIGDRLRYLGHTASETALEIRQHDAVSGLDVTTHLERYPGVDAFRASTTVTNMGVAPLLLQSVTSLALHGMTGWLGPTDATHLWTARNEWCAENRWASEPLRAQRGLPEYDTALHGQGARGVIERTGYSTWPSGDHLPVAVLTNEESGRALAWQVEVNGPWHWELTSRFAQEDWIGLALNGPTDLHHSWLLKLQPGASFTTVPVSLAFSTASLDGALAALTAHRRRSRVRPDAGASDAVVFNDYMNTVMGDPTRQRLLPLIDAAAAAGAEYFCIDAGWYDDDGDWWPSVGAWEPSVVRFGEQGLAGVLDYIRAANLKPGLWIEPEVIGVRSPLARSLPDEAFMTRRGVRIREHDRYFLDLRSQAARDYLDGVFDRLLGEYGARYIKWDYNVTPGTGPDRDASTRGPRCSTTRSPTWSGSSGCASATRRSCSRRAPLERSARTARHCVTTTCSPPLTSRTTGAIPRSPPPRRW